jgi:hypothetical protein
MPLAFIDRSASVGWCPVGHQPLLAAGTQSGAIDMSFSTSSVLEVSPVHAGCCLGATEMVKTHKMVLAGLLYGLR